MKILMLHNRYLVPGGEDQSSAAEAALLRDFGHEVEFVEEDNRRIEQLGKAKTAVRTVWSSESYRRIYGKLQSGKFDVLHVQNFFPLWSPSVYYAAAKSAVPVVQTLRNYRLLCVNSLLFRNQHVCEDCLGRFAPWRGVLHACYHESRAASAVVALMAGTHKLMGTWNKRIHAYVALTEFARAKYVAGGLPSEKIIVKPNFIHPAPAPGGGGGGYAIYVGRLSAEKGIAAMLEAWKTAGSPIRLKIAGSGPLQDVVREAASVCPAIEFIGNKTLAEVLDLMRQAEFLVFPSEWYETMGRTIMEAFAVGTPVVAARIGPPASMVSEKTGFHFAPGSVAELRERVEWCSRNLDFVRSMRSQARSAFEEHYTGPVNAEKLLAIYRMVQRQAQLSRGRPAN